MLATLDTGTSIEALAASVHMSKRHFLRLFKRVTGTTPHSWRVEERVRGSLRDLQNRDLGLAEIAHRYGFADHAHYSRVFRRVVGTPPSVWRTTVTCNERHEKAANPATGPIHSISGSSQAEQESTKSEGRTGSNVNHIEQEGKGAFQT
nr:helix-turn-helix transcriptional regulator [Paraburkholderia terrae]